MNEGWQDVMAPCAGNDADMTVNLRGLEEDAAIKRLTAALRRAGDENLQSMVVAIDPPRHAGDYTLFQPVGRLLRDYQGIESIARIRFLAESDVRGFHVEFETTRAA